MKKLINRLLRSIGVLQEKKREKIIAEEKKKPIVKEKKKPIDLIKVWELGCKNTKYLKENVKVGLFIAESIVFEYNRYIMLIQIYDNEKEMKLKTECLEQIINKSDYNRLKEMYYGCSEKERKEKERLFEEKKAKDELKLRRREEIEEIKFFKEELKK